MQIRRLLQGLVYRMVKSNRPMILQTNGIASSPKDPDYGDMAFVYCVGPGGWGSYCVSLSRPPDESLIEVMVRDQTVHRTSEVSVELWPDKLNVKLSPAAAYRLDNITEYEVRFPPSAKEVEALHSALTVIFAKVGKYERRA